MDTHTDSGAPAQEAPQPGWRERVGKLQSHVPAVVVTIMAVMAVATAVVVTHLERRGSEQAQVQVRIPAAETVAQQAAQPSDVVQAPPLKAAPNPARSLQGVPAPSSGAMGAGPGCANCGVVELVVAVKTQPQAQARTYQMHIRMDDGTVRTVEQRGALAAGSRVVVVGHSAKVPKG